APPPSGGSTGAVRVHPAPAAARPGAAGRDRPPNARRGAAEPRGTGRSSPSGPVSCVIVADVMTVIAHTFPPGRRPVRRPRGTMGALPDEVLQAKPEKNLGDRGLHAAMM